MPIISLKSWFKSCGVYLKKNTGGAKPEESTALSLKIKKDLITNRSGYSYKVEHVMNSVIFSNLKVWISRDFTCLSSGAISGVCSLFDWLPIQTKLHPGGSSQPRSRPGTTHLALPSMTSSVPDHFCITIHSMITYLT